MSLVYYPPSSISKSNSGRRPLSFAALLVLAMELRLDVDLAPVSEIALARGANDVDEALETVGGLESRSILSECCFRNLIRCPPFEPYASG